MLLVEGDRDREVLIYQLQQRGHRVAGRIGVGQVRVGQVRLEKTDGAWRGEVVNRFVSETRASGEETDRVTVEVNSTEGIFRFEMSTTADGVLETRRGTSTDRVVRLFEDGKRLHLGTYRYSGGVAPGTLSVLENSGSGGASNLSRPGSLRGAPIIQPHRDLPQPDSIDFSDRIKRGQLTTEDGTHYKGQVTLGDRYVTLEVYGSLAPTVLAKEDVFLYTLLYFWALDIEGI